jgi:hypothetical protein
MTLLSLFSKHWLQMHKKITVIKQVQMTSGEGPQEK